MAGVDIIAHVSREELEELQVRRNALTLMKASYLLAQRGWGAQIGEILRRYRREGSNERLRINLTTGAVEVAPEEVSDRGLKLTAPINGVEPEASA